MRRATYDEAAAQIGKSVVYGATRLDRVVRVAEAADQAGYSAYHFQRLFHAMAGEPWAEFHRRLRLERAAVLICDGNRPSEVSHVCGFESQESFVRAFRSAFGCTPTAILKQPSYPPLLPTPNGVHAFDPPSIDRFQTLRRPGESIEYEIRKVRPMNLVGIMYQGPIQFISNAWLELNDWAKMHGIDLNQRLLVTFAEELSEETPPELQTAYVAIDDKGEVGLSRYSVGGGDFLVARHVGSGHLLTDFWLRIYGECIPESGRILRPTAPFQIYPFSLFSENPDEFVTDLYIPVEHN